MTQLFSSCLGGLSWPLILCSIASRMQTTISLSVSECQCERNRQAIYLGGTSSFSESTISESIIFCQSRSESIFVEWKQVMHAGGTHLSLIGKTTDTHQTYNCIRLFCLSFQNLILQNTLENSVLYCFIVQWFSEVFWRLRFWNKIR